MDDSHQPIPTPLSQRLSDFRKGPLTVLAWLVAASLAALMLTQRSRSFEYSGLARAMEYEVSAAVTGRVESVPVDLFEEVESGQVVAVLDGAELGTRLQTAAAELSRLKSELEAEAARNSVHSADITGELRRFQIDEEQLRLDLLATRVELESDRVEKSRLDLKVARQEALFQDGLVAQSDLEDTRLLRDALGKRIEENEVLLSRIKEEHRAAMRRREGFEARFARADADDPMLKPLRDAVEVQALRIAELEQMRRGLVLRAPVSGRVSEVLAQRGQSVLPGEPLVLVADRVATEVLAYLPETQATELGADKRVLVASADGRRVVESAIDRKSPTIKVLPQRLWRDPATPEYGLPLVVRGIAALGLVPGERVTLRLMNEG